MILARALALIVAFALGVSLCVGAVSAQSETATAEDGAPAAEAPTESATAEDGAPASDAPTESAAPSVPLGANLTPPLGALPPSPDLAILPGTGNSGASTVSMAPGTLTTGAANEGRNAVRAPEAEPAPAPETVPAPESAPVPEPVPEAAPAASSTCADYPTWYDAQLALESSVDPALNGALDPDGDTIACEEVMYP